MKEKKRKVAEKLTIRVARGDEFGKVVTIYVDEGSRVEAKAVKKVVEKEFGDIKSGKRIILFAEIDKKPVGTVQLILESSNKEHADGKDLSHLHHLKTHKKYCRKGIGEALTYKVENIAREKGFKRMTLGVDEDNPYAKKLYEKWGYGLLKIEPGRTKRLKLFILYKDL
ncbi:MAG: GNAT family N-acetyltransferase [bacterium]|nr:GNAT family N-acetyltransferase [bacterium]